MKGEKDMQKKKTSQSGITLIALVVTIVVLILLAAISINALIGENGIIQKATESSIKQDNASVKEALRLKVLEYSSKKITEGTYPDILDMLGEGNYIAEEKVNVQQLIGQKLNTGNGTGNRDVYKIEDYHLKYYDKNGMVTDLGEIENLQNEVTENEDLLKYLEFNKETGEITGLINCEEYYYLYGQSAFKSFPIENVVIPKEIDGVPVKKVDFGIFNRCISIKSLVFQEGIQIVADRIYDLPSLETIKILGKSSEIPLSNFWMLKEYIIEENPNYQTINGMLCSKDGTKLELYPPLTKQEIPDSVTIIDGQAFRNTKIAKIPNRLTKIEGDLDMEIVVYETGPNRLERKQELIENGVMVVDLNDNSEGYIVENNAIYNKDKTELLSVGNTADFVIPETVKGIAVRCFEKVPLKKIIIPSQVTTIGEYAFSDCTILSNVTIQNGVKTIGNYAFDWCPLLLEITIPNSVETIGDHTFSTSFNLRVINVDKPENSIEGAPWGSFSFQHETTVNWRGN